MSTSILHVAHSYILFSYFCHDIKYVDCVKMIVFLSTIFPLNFAITL